MAKPFLTYDQQITKLITEKDLIINDLDFAKEKLKEVGYYHLITGYKDLFRNKVVKKYKRGVCFEDIYFLYEFDKALREIIFKYLQIIELTFASHISYYFCEIHGCNQDNYLNSRSYNNSSKYKNKSGLIDTLNSLANDTKKFNNITYNRNIYHNVPLWIIINHLTFGGKSKLYEILQSPMQNKISDEYNVLTATQLAQIIRFLIKARNICAHGNRLYNFKSNENMPDLKSHENLKIFRYRKQYIYGKNDLFGVVIAFRYLCSSEDFDEFFNGIDKLILSFLSSTSFLDENDILTEMGFPSNWKDVLSSIE